jgi:2,3-bisphosphoglycerate-independent phosphoglycerate mutase
MYKLRAAAIAAYPMYRGVARLVGMEVLEVHGESPEALFQEAAAHWEHFDFFFIHIKPTDSRGKTAISPPRSGSSKRWTPRFPSCWSAARMSW